MSHDVGGTVGKPQTHMLANPPRPRGSTFRVPLLMLTTIVFFSWSTFPTRILAQNYLEQLPGGLRVDDSSKNRKWNRVVLLARPKLSSGDIDAIPSPIRPAVSKFILSIIADVQPISGPQGKTSYTLNAIGVGYSTSLNKQLRIATLGEVEAGKLSLGFIEKQMLRENTKQIQRIAVVAKRDNMAVFDAPAILLRDGEHRDFTMRHFVWVDSKSGKLSSLVWLVQEDRRGRRVTDDSIRWVPSGMKESREIHVDGKEFSLLGIPSDRAFALEDLPPGKEIPWTAEARAIAARPSYLPDEISALAQALNDTLAVVRQTQPQSN